MAVGPSREELIEEARKRGITEPEKLAPRELERIVSTGRPSQSFWSRFLGRVRGALGSEGSHVPVAERTPNPPSGGETTGDEMVSDEPIPTRTMAGLLAEQGHEERALAIYDRLLDGPAVHAANVEARTDLRAELKAERDAVHQRLEARSQETQSQEQSVGIGPPWSRSFLSGVAFSSRGTFHASSWPARRRNSVPMQP